MCWRVSVQWWATNAPRVAGDDCLNRGDERLGIRRSLFDVFILCKKPETAILLRVCDGAGAAKMVELLIDLVRIVVLDESKVADRGRHGCCTLLLRRLEYSKIVQPDSRKIRTSSWAFELLRGVGGLY